MAIELPVVRIAPNNPVFDLPVMVGIEEKLFEKAGLNVQMTGKWSDREKHDNITLPSLERTKEQAFECGTADGNSGWEWASVDRLELGMRSGATAAPLASVAAERIM